MDPEIGKLKQEVVELKAVTKDTNRLMHSMRRSQRLQTIIKVVWWLTILGVSGYAYLTYIQPYVTGVMDAYGNAQEFQVQVQDWFAQFGRSGQ